VVAIDRISWSRCSGSPGRDPPDSPVAITRSGQTQGGLIRRLTEAFVYGAFRTYQVPITLIETESGLDFSQLTPHDPFARQRREEGVEGKTDRLFNPIASSADLILA